ncbi:hypothetical protein V6N12_013477 [Hibiscus sabdariffa]|uniref:Endonuclease/exonuclease/phosphatase domain-containing protein n=1 Tax=Hibiscus sabdariffa TaxID=183260 RepID=A0ABR2BI43_9ROSI
MNSHRWILSEAFGGYQLWCSCVDYALSVTPGLGIGIIIILHGYVGMEFRGLGNKDMVRALKNAAFKHRTDIIFLSEMKQKKRYIEKIRMKMKIGNAFYVEPDGIVGGLALWWSNGVKLFVLHYDKNFIDTKISFNVESEWFDTFIYAPPYTEEKHKFWDSLAALRNDINAKWCIIGDFNVVVCPEKNMERCNDEAILEKLDRVVSSLEWDFLFLKAISIIDVAIALDHSPIIFLTNGVKNGKIEKMTLQEVPSELSSKELE